MVVVFFASGGGEITSGVDEVLLQVAKLGLMEGTS